jgi:hypothetical protein
MSKQYLNLFPGDELKGSMSSWGNKPLANSHKEGFTPKEDIVLKAGENYKLTVWKGETKNSGYPTVSVVIEPWQPYTGGSSDEKTPF